MVNTDRGGQIPVKRLPRACSTIWFRVSRHHCLGFCSPVSAVIFVHFSVARMVVFLGGHHIEERRYWFEKALRLNPVRPIQLVIIFTRTSSVRAAVHQLMSSAKSQNDIIYELGSTVRRVPACHAENIVRLANSSNTHRLGITPAWTAAVPRLASPSHTRQSPSILTADGYPARQTARPALNVAPSHAACSSTGAFILSTPVARHRSSVLYVRNYHRRRARRKQSRTKADRRRCSPAPPSVQIKHLFVSPCRSAEVFFFPMNVKQASLFTRDAIHAQNTRAE